MAHRIRAVLADNTRRLMEKRYAESPNKPRALAVAAGVSLSTVQRILAAEIGASADNVGHIADVFKLQVYQLFIPALDVNAPQALAAIRRVPKGKGKAGERPHA